VAGNKLNKSSHLDILYFPRGLWQAEINIKSVPMHGVKIPMENLRLLKGAMWVQRSLIKADSPIVPPCHYATPECYVVIDVSLEMKERIRLDFCVYWEPIGDDSEGASDKERIIRYISELPSEDFLQDINTLDQLRQWVSTKNSAIRLAKCWNAYGTPEDPIAADLNNDWIDWWEHDYTWYLVGLYENLWQLINHKGSDIKAVFLERDKMKKSLRDCVSQGGENQDSQRLISKLPKELRMLSQGDYLFDSSRDLLQEIARRNLEVEFVNCLKPHHIDNAKEIKEMANLTRKESRDGLDANEWKKHLNLIAKYTPESFLFLLHRVLGSCQMRIFGDFQTSRAQDEITWSHLRVHDEIADKLSQMHQLAACDPALKHHGQISYVWKNGVRSEGVNSGWRA